MPEPTHPPARRRSAAQPFKPRFTLSLLYLLGSFFVFALLLVTPALLEALQTLPEHLSPEEELEVARSIARDTLRPRLGIAIAAAILTVGIGAYTQRLPGLRE
ncbi:hypothetical protein MK489_21330 [Myxococcota bacterium]|nr:hypothetical protein [Myxococcota bacterium]